MKTTVLIASLILAPLGVIVCATIARAENAECSAESMSAPIGEEAALGVAKQNGWTVAKIIIDDNCYVLKGKDQEGRSISVDLDPNSLTIENFDYLDKDGKPIPYVDPAAKAPDSKTKAK
jgi:hypothetical protein